MIDQRKFDELVDNTTRYLTNILERLAKLEEEVAELKKPAKRTTKNAQ